MCDPEEKIRWLPTPCGKCGVMLDRPDGSCLMMMSPGHGCFYVCGDCLDSYPVAHRLGTPYPKHPIMPRAVSPPELAFHEIGVALREVDLHTKSILEVKSDIRKEADPTGRKPSDPGAKLDQGKVRMGLVMGGFANALREVCIVGTKGAAKYTDNGWKEVPNGQARYMDALHRHVNKHQAGELIDHEWELLHLAHAAWNALAILELELKNRKDAQ